MSDLHKELLSELIKDWPLERIEEYIIQLEQRRVEMDDWIKHAKTIRIKKVRKPVYDTGVRGGA
jgi:hypothetical protein